jgi:hypothetical protein
MSSFIFRGKPEEKEEEESFVKQVSSQVADYLFSLVVPVAILTYVAPQKSLNYIADNAYSKVSMVTDIDMEVVWNTTSDLFNKTVPMLQMEGEVLGQLIEKSDDFIVSVYNSPWIDTLVSYWQYTAGVLAVLALVMLLFPWRKLVDWVAGSIWRTIILFMGVLPLDDGLETLSDKETGNYEVFIVIGAVALTLLINYLTWCLVWWGIRSLTSLVLRLMGKGIKQSGSAVWGTVTGSRYQNRKIAELQKTDENAKNSPQNSPRNSPRRRFVNDGKRKVVDEENQQVDEQEQKTKEEKPQVEEEKPKEVVVEEEKQVEEVKEEKKAPVDEAEQQAANAEKPEEEKKNE